MDPYFKPAKSRERFEQLEDLVQAQRKAIKNTRLSEDEVSEGHINAGSMVENIRTMLRERGLQLRGFSD